MSEKPPFSTPDASGARTPRRRSWRVIGGLAAIALGAALIAASTNPTLRARFIKKPQPLPVVPSFASVAVAAPAIQPASAITLPKPATTALPEHVEDRINRLDVQLNQALRDLSASRAEVKALEQRIAKLEAALDKANSQVQALSKKAEETAAKEKELEAKRVASAAAARPAAAQTKTPIRKGRKAPNRATKTTARGSAAAAVAVSERSRHRAQGALLAVDIWDGKPSAVIGTGIPGDRRVRVLQPGEQLAGVALVKADARRGSATFATGTGVFTMFVDERSAP